MELHCTADLFAFRPNQSCAENYVAPKSGLYIDDLPNISIASMSGTGKHTYSNAQELLNGKTRMAVASMMQDLNGEMLKAGRVMPQMQPTSTLGRYEDEYIVPAAAGAGLSVRREVGCTPLSVLYIHSLFYQGNINENIILNIYSEQTGTLLDSYPLAAVAYEQRQVIVDKHYAVNVRITAMAVGMPAKVNLGKSCSCLYQLECHRGTNHYHKHLQAYGFDGVEQSEYGYGITVCGAARCYLPALLCYTLPNLYTALYYKVGALMLQELLGFQAPADYTNGYVAKTPLDKTYEELKKEAQKYTTIAVQSMLVNLQKTDSFCISCNTPSAVIRRSLS